MNQADPNRERLLAMAAKLAPLLSELIFVGGSATGLLITDPAGSPVRPTVDVDVIAEVTSYAEYTSLGDRLKELGFQNDSESGRTDLSMDQ